MAKKGGSGKPKGGSGKPKSGKGPSKPGPQGTRAQGPKGSRSGKQKGRGKAASQEPQRNPSSSKLVIGEMTAGERIAWVCLHLAVFVVPVAMSNATWLGFQMPFTYDQFDIIKVFFQRAFALVGVAAWGWSALTQGGKFRRTRVNYVVIAFLLWVALTTVLSIHWPTALFGKYRRFEGFISFVNYAALFFLTLQLVDRPSRIRSLARTLFFSGTIVSFYGLLQYLSADPVNWGPQLPFEATRSFSTYGNPDLLGGFLMFPLPVSIALALSEDDDRWRAVYWVGFLLTTACWVTAFTRGAWIGGLVGFFFLAIAAWRLQIRLRNIDWAFVGGAAVLVSVIVARSLNNPNDVLNVAKRVRSIFEFDKGSALTRFQIWQSAIDAVKDKPIFGFGPDTFRLVFPKYKPYEYVAAAGYLSVADNVHNYPLQLASGIGIPGVAWLYSTFGYAAWRSAPAAFAKGKGPERLLLAGLWAAAAAYVAHLIFGLSVTGSSFLMWITMALVLTPVARTTEFSPPKWGLPVAAGLVALCALGSVGNTLYLVADNHYLKARVATTGIQRVQEVEKALRLNPYNDMYRSELGLAYQDIFRAMGSDFVSRQQSGEDTTQLRAQLREAFELAERKLQAAIDFTPYEYDNYVFLANHYNVASDFLGDLSLSQKAVEVGRKGVEVEPHGPAIRVQLGMGLRRLNDFDEAIEQFKVAADMDPNYADAHMLLGETLSQAGRPDEARRVFSAWLERHPDDSFARNSLDALPAADATSVE